MGAQLICEVERSRIPGLAWAVKPPVESVIRSLAPEDQVLLTKLLTEPVEFVEHARLSSTTIDRELFGGPARLVDSHATQASPIVPTPWSTRSAAANAFPP